MSRILGSVAVDLGSDPVAATYGLDFRGEEYGLLKLGDALTVHVSDTSPTVLRQLAQAALELADFRERQLAGQLERVS